jgi:hypothetical protein
VIALEQEMIATVELLSIPHVDYTPVRTLEGLTALDSDQVQRGYWAGLDNELFNGRERCPAFVHGYLNGQVDGGHIEPSEAQCALMDEVRELRSHSRH